VEIAEDSAVSVFLPVVAQCIKGCHSANGDSPTRYIAGLGRCVQDVFRLRALRRESLVSVNVQKLLNFLLTQKLSEMVTENGAGNSFTEGFSVE
jgi:hypothetical protein